MVGSGPHQVESMGSQRQDHRSDLKQRRDREGIEKGVCILLTLLGASLGVGAMSLMRKMLRICSWRLI